MDNNPQEEKSYAELEAENKELKEVVKFLGSRYRPELTISRNFYEEERWEKIKELIKKHTSP